ncbi:MAG TPA: protein-disulfide reductase DsbD domain-containing protein [Capsulimonadaceae bacterium]|nr:protein-disulfide reductase DsbD domain-containing protein [Capsulimonadaceae bacterium]
MFFLQYLRKKYILGLGLLSATALVAAVALPTWSAGTTYAKVSVAAQPSTLKPGRSGAIIITINVAKDFHINSAKPADPNLIPTKLEMKQVAGFRFGTVAYPRPRSVRESYSPQPLSVYEGNAVIRVPVTASPSLKPGRYILNGVLTYQGCNHAACYPPQNPTIRVPITVK